MSCAVCEGEGRYPVINRYGTQLYTIQCPECFGDGLSEDEADRQARIRADQRRYDAAMADMFAGKGGVR